MEVYIDIVMVLNFLVDFFLLMGTNRLCGYPVFAKQCALAAVLGGVYGGACLLPGLLFLGNSLWRLVFLILMAGIAFGWKRSSARRGVVFLLVSLALGGLMSVTGNKSVLGLFAAALGVCLLCGLGLAGRSQTRLVPVRLSYENKNVKLLALHDTGNSLRDPITGRSVLVVSPDVAGRLIGLTRDQLAQPLEVMRSGKISGLQLIPYHSVGKNNGLLLALRLHDVTIGKWKGSTLVAFAPEGFSSEGEYEALTGGAA